MNVICPANETVLRRLATTSPGPVTVVRPEEVHRPYDSLGCHPDIVARIWDEIGRTLPGDCRWVVCRRPVLVHPGSGVVLALGMGTQYALRIAASDYPAALSAGLSSTTMWAGGKTTDLAGELGRDWLFGHWAREEIQWCANTYHAHEDR